MIGRLACPPCASLFVVEQWLWQKKNVVTLNFNTNKKHRGVHITQRKSKQLRDPVNIFHSLFKIIESENV